MNTATRIFFSEEGVIALTSTSDTVLFEYDMSMMMMETKYPCMYTKVKTK